ncbi:MAG: potassium channel family protein [Pseudomonadota bacterium]|nr:potassium channel family protein [Pseudomonadota bacterium]
MYQPWGANAIVVLATVLAVALVVLVHYEGLNLLSRWLAHQPNSQRRRRAMYGIFGALMLRVLEIWVFGFAAAGLLLLPGTGNISGSAPTGLLDAVYFLATTYVTLGIGDLTPVGPIRFLSGMVALVGFMLIAWSASFTYVEISRNWRDRL